VIRLEVYARPTGYKGQIQLLVTDPFTGTPTSSELWACDHQHPDYIEAEACGEAELRRRLKASGSLPAVLP
jgi:hypothetical protein